MHLFKMAGKLFNWPFFKMAADAILKFIKINIFVIVMTITTNEVSICTILCKRGQEYQFDVIFYLKDINQHMIKGCNNM